MNVQCILAFLGWALIVLAVSFQPTHWVAVTLIGTAIFVGVAASIAKEV